MFRKKQVTKEGEKWRRKTWEKEKLRGFPP